MAALANQEPDKNYLRVTQSEFITEFFEELIRLIGSATILEKVSSSRPMRSHIFRPMRSFHFYAR